MNLNKLLKIGVIFTLCINLFTISIVKADPKDELENLNFEITNLEQKQQEIINKIDTTNLNLTDINIEIEQTKIDITNTEKEINNIEDKIQVKKQELQQQKKKKDQQYKNMKKRIQYIYEKGGQTGLFLLILKEDDIVNFLNKIEYTDKICNYDRVMLLEFINTIQKIQQIEKQLQQDKKDLIEQKKVLELQKIGLEEQQEELENEILEMSKQKILIEVDLEQAQKDAAALAYEIAEIDREIAAKEAEKEEIENNQEQLISGDESYHTSSSAAFLEDQEEQQLVKSESNYSNSDITAYADQFVGNPYVWGGNSLTQGCDCSHFVYNVLKDTGYYDGGYATSGEWANLGTFVDGLSSAQAGDVIVYSGHVAIYDGEGSIIQAKGSNYGITHDRQADCKSIVAIRRFTQ